MAENNKFLEGKKPKYILYVVDKNNKYSKTKAGAIFENEYGFNMVLNPGVSIDYKMQQDFWLSIRENKPFDPDWNDKKEEEEAKAKKGGKPSDDDIPF